MSRISVEPDELEALASAIGKLERHCEDIKGTLKWNYSIMHSTNWDIDHTSIGGIYQILVQKLEHYKSLLNSAQEVVKKTEAKFREADQGWFSKAKEIGMEIVGINDVVRIFAEYDPVTGEKLDGWDRLKAVGWTALTVFPPAKVVGMGGKAVIKGSKVLHMGEKAAKTFHGIIKVLNPNVIKNAFKSAMIGIKEIPLFPRLGRVIVSSVGIHRIPAEPIRVKDLMRFAHSDNKTIVTADESKYTLGTMKHIYHGEINRRGKAVGYHHESIMGGKIIPGTESKPDVNGVYRANVEVEGIRKKAKSSFFPKNWDRIKVQEAINEAFANKQLVKDNKYIGVHSSGIKVEMYLNKDGSIATAYPLYRGSN